MHFLMTHTHRVNQLCGNGLSWHSHEVYSPIRVSYHDSYTQTTPIVWDQIYQDTHTEYTYTTRPDLSRQRQYTHGVEPDLLWHINTEHIYRMGSALW